MHHTAFLYIRKWVFVITCVEHCPVLKTAKSLIVFVVSMLSILILSFIHPVVFSYN